ncbi:hypothetical protein BOX15_Mlig010364g8 [Macrostomum lignano]|uniref:Uncharacterized protein n=1 Tax=Macrostomum lignano TaxID=282301 RepID=A0A267GIY2_9PLAT|nr:hypothetical protein BOX15_Mlig010364g10 [Macrostomum lignano]PAA86015.1 hypothetical protein BOX15_Mlig010364g8 [Macrostomum lignano]
MNFASAMCTRGMIASRDGCTSTLNEPRSGRPRKVRTESSIKLIRGLLEIDPRWTCKEMAELSKIPSSSIHKTLIEDLWLQYVTVRWVPHHLDDSQEAGNKSSLPNNFLDAIDEKATSCQNWLCILNDIYSSAQRAGAAAAEF